MSTAIRVLGGKFGRVALLNMDGPLVEHAHHHCHLLIKSWGHDTQFLVQGEERRLTDDAAVLINAWEPHCYAHRARAPETVILALYIEPAWLASAEARLFGGSPSLFFADCQAPIGPEARRLVRRLSDQLLSDAEPGPQELETALFSLIMSVMDRSGALSAVRTLSPVSDFRIRRAITHLRQNLSSPVGMDDLASLAGLSRPHFFTLFRRCTGVTPGMFYNVLRMEEAIRCLSTGAQPVGRLAFDLGFEAQSNFTRFFRQHQGVAPSDFRKAIELVP